jgi:GntR family transcriptional repressor for pyruvate dehydrogenase complex
MAKVRRSTVRRAASSAPFLPLKSGRKSDQVFEQISAFIRSGRFANGSRLPAERELTEMFNTSRQTVREAIYHAELVGLVEVRHGSGSFIVSRKPQVCTERSFADLVAFEAHRVGEFFEIRRALEGWCASQAARLGTETDFHVMKERLDAMRDLDVTDEAWERNDIGFHQALAAATGNPLAIRIMEVLREGFAVFYRLKRYIPNREDQKTIWQHHVEIYDALCAHAPKRARAALVAHMDFIEGKLAESVSDVRAGRG